MAPVSRGPKRRSRVKTWILVSYAAMFETPAAVMAWLTGIAALFFLIEAKTKWKVLNFFPPLLWIYARRTNSDPIARTRTHE